MFHLAGASGRIHVEEHADAAGHAVGYSHLGRAEQRHLVPAHRARGFRGVVRGEIGRGREEPAHHVVRGETVGLLDGAQQLFGRFEDRLRGVRGRGRCAAQPSQDLSHDAR